MHIQLTWEHQEGKKGKKEKNLTACKVKLLMLGEYAHF